jgi:hypothetical protein
MLRSVDDIVDALGGTGAAAELVGLGRSAISNWRARGTIPAENFLTVASELEKRGLEVDPAAFGFKVTEASP